MFVVRFERAAALLLAITLCIHIQFALGQLVVVSECVCPGRELRLQCTVVGIGSTVWKGTAFDCGRHIREIILRHTQFETATGVCNRGMVIGRSVDRTFDGSNSTFTSQLTINLPLLNDTNNTLDGRTIECIYDNGVNVTNVGTHTIAYTREAPPAPDNVHLAQVSKNALTFQWDPVQSVCPDNIIGYKVIATNCGVCPNTTLSTSVTCITSSMLTTNISKLCSLSVETTACGTNTGNRSNAVTAVFKAPGSPMISSVLPYYSASSRELLKVDVDIKSDPIESYNISDGIDGSINSYTFNITFLDSDLDCSSTLATLPTSSCVGGICSATLTNLTSLPCYKNDSQAEVAVYASNVLTAGPPSTALLNTSNIAFFVEYKPLGHSFSCQFVGRHENKSCVVTYGPVDPTGQPCLLENHVTHTNSSDGFVLDTVTVHVPSLAQTDHDESKLFCFRAVGTTPVFTIAVEGTFTIIGTSTDFKTNTDLIVVTTIAVLCSTVILILLAFIVILSKILIKKGRCGLRQTEHRQQNLQALSQLTDEHTDQQTIYSEVTPLNVNGNNTIFVLQDDDKVEYAELNHQHRHAMKTVVESSSCETADDSLTLDSLLIQLRSQVTPVWYKFGLSLGVSKDTLNRYTGYPDEECIVEVLDYWLRNHDSKPTWREVAKSLKDIGLSQLADGVLNVYKTGKLPVEVDMEAIPQDLLDKLDTETLPSTQESPPPLPPKYS